MFQFALRPQDAIRAESMRNFHKYAVSLFFSFWYVLQISTGAEGILT